MNLIQKLATQDKVDFILGPYSTAIWFATSPIFAQYKYPVVAPTVDSLQLKAMWQEIPYTFVILNQPAEKAQAMVDLVHELGIKTFVAANHQDLHGIEPKAWCRYWSGAGWICSSTRASRWMPPTCPPYSRR